MSDAVLVLTGQPTAVTDDVAQAVAAAAGQAVGQVRWLGAGACEMALPDSSPERLRAAREAADGASVDVNLVLVANRRKRALIADMDATMVQTECIDELAALAGVGGEVAAITERAMAGEIDFVGALRDRVRLLEGLAVEVLATAWETRIHLTPGAKALVGTMAAAGAATALVSGGFTYFTERVAAATGFREHRANELLAKDGLLTGEVAEPVLGRDAKVEALSDLMARFGLTAQDVVAVGDGANDIGMIEAAGLGVGYRPKAALAAVADAVIRHSDLTALLSLQGYTEAEIIPG